MSGDLQGREGVDLVHKLPLRHIAEAHAGLPSDLPLHRSQDAQHGLEHGRLPGAVGPHDAQVVARTRTRFRSVRTRRLP